MMTGIQIFNAGNTWFIFSVDLHLNKWRIVVRREYCSVEYHIKSASRIQNAM